MTPAGLRGVVNDAVAIYFLDAALAAAFVSRWCAELEGRDQRGGISGAQGSANPARALDPDRTRLFEEMGRLLQRV
jgi:hypothetical protein